MHGLMFCNVHVAFPMWFRTEFAARCFVMYTRLVCVLLCMIGLNVMIVIACCRWIVMVSLTSCCALQTRCSHMFIFHSDFVRFKQHGLRCLYIFANFIHVLIMVLWTGLQVY